jgi:gluconokinase
MASTQTDSLILSLDIGTSSVRATLFDASARALPDMQARRETDVRTTPDGGVEVDPDALVESICACLDQVMRLAGARGRDVVAVGSATLVGNVLGVGRDGRAVTPLYTWADTRATQEAADLRASLDEVVIHDRTGCMLRSSYLPAQLRWLRRAAPDLVRRVDRWLSIGEYLHLRLFGTSTVSYSVASWSGLLDRRCLDWDGELLAVAGVRAEQLSPLVDRDMPATG